MSFPEIVLYDLASRGRCACWSPNVWKTRLVLNYKGIPYRTEWVNHDSMAPVLKATGVAPNALAPQGGSEYTVPTVRFPDGSYLRDSAAIAAKLESLYPEPSLYLDTGLQDKALAANDLIGKNLFPVFIPRILNNMLVESSVPNWRELREKRMGMSIEQIEAKMGGDPAWQAAEPGFAAMREVLTEHKRDEGPFILGSQPSYGDFVAVGMMHSLKRIETELAERFMSQDPCFEKLYDACKQWTEKDD